MPKHCTRGKANPSQPTRYRLWADSASFCQNPSCTRQLFVDSVSVGSVHFGEIAHVIAASQDGPRGDGKATAQELGDWSNLILLCANCHTLIDKTPMDYPSAMLLHWKERRKNDVEQAIGIGAFSTRQDARRAIDALLEHNRYLHQSIGPDNDYRFDPEAEEAAMWQHEMRNTIIPNHRAILKIIANNRDHLKPDERRTVAEYASHVDGLINRHEGSGGLRTVRYPSGMDSLYV